MDGRAGAVRPSRFSWPYTGRTSQSTAARAVQTAMTDELETYLATTADRRLASYLEFLRIPSISGQPEYAEACREAAQWVAGQLSSMGVEHVEVAETGGHPVVYGDWLHAPDAPTVIVYGHYDVQPVDPIELWETAPFEPFVKGDRVIGRGSSDDKGQIHIHLRATEAILATRGALPVNLRFVFEGEEESSSVHLDAWLEANRERLTGDLAVISDRGCFGGNRPATTVGLRGICSVQVDVSTTAVDLHSGSFGGAVQNPVNALAQIIAALKGPDGRIRGPGFYVDVEAYRTALGLPALVGEAGYSTLERRGGRPTLDVNGIWGGFQGEGSKTIIPAHAHAKISCRLVVDQDPSTIFELLRAFVLEVAPPGCSVEVQELGGGRPSLTPIDHPATQAAARALEATFGVAPLYIREGGSIPVCASFESILGLPVVLLGFTPPDDNAHAPNESMSLSNHETAIRTLAVYWDQLAGLPR